MSFYLLTAICFGVLGNFLYGYNTSVLNAPQMVIQQFLIDSFKERYDIELTTESAATYFSIVVTMYLVGGMVGALSAGWVAEKFGRKLGMTYPQILSLLAAVLMGSCKYYSSYEMLLIGRTLVGIADGLLTGILPTYISEIAPIHIRGTLGTFNMFGATVGMLTVMVLGIDSILGGVATWPLLLALIAIPSGIQLVLLIFLPEPPRYLILSKGKIKEAEDALKKLRGIDNVSQEIRSIQIEEQSNKKEAKYSIWQLLSSNELRLSLTVAVCLHFSQQMSGIFAIFVYSTSFFNSAGIDESISQYSTIGVGVILVLMSFVVMQLMERVGRRILILNSYGGIVICSILITVALNYNNNESSGIFLVVFTLLFVVFYASGAAAVPWIAVAELFTQGPRAAAVGICVFVNWLAHMVVSFVFPQLQTNYLQWSFLPFLITTAICFVFLLIYFPETKNTATNEIALLFQVPNAWTTPIGFKKPHEEKLLNSKSYADYGSKLGVPKIITTQH